MTEQTPSGPNFEAPGHQAPPSSWVPPTGPAVIPGQYPSNYAPVPGQYPAQPVGPYPAQPGPYPAQPGPYPAQPGPYPGQPGAYPPPAGQYQAYPPQLAPQNPYQAQPQGPENVGRGLLFASGAVVVGIVLTGILASVGYLTALTSFVISAGGVALYVKGAGTRPKKGLVPLLVLIVVGVVLSFFALSVPRAIVDYNTYFAGQGSITMVQYVTSHLFDYVSGTTAGLFVLFAALGMMGTLRRIR